MLNFHNSIELTGSDLATANEKAETQQQAVLEFFRRHSGGCFTPLQVHRSLGLNCPETSIRRAITNLTTAGFLEKTAMKVDESYGKVNYTWKLSNGQQKLF